MYDQMTSAVRLMNKEAQKENKHICFRNSNYQYNLGLDYINEKQFPNQELRRFSEDDYDLGCKFFFLTRSYKGKRDIDEEFLVRFEVAKQHQIGALTVWELEFNDEALQEIKDKGLANPPEDEEKDDETRIIRWEQL